MPGFVLHSTDCEQVSQWIDVAHDSQLPPPDPGMMWTAVPDPARRYSVTLGPDGQTPIPLLVVPGAAERLLAAKEDRWAEAKAYREQWLSAGCMTPLGRVDSDAESRAKISGAVQMAMIAASAGEPFEIAWTMSDNSVVAHDAAAVIAMGMAAGRFVDGCHQAATAIRLSINEASDTAAVAAIDITTGYPT